MILILFLISAAGLTHIIVDSVIAQAPVEWLKTKLPDKILWFHPKEALDCHQCTGFWVGMLCALVWGMPVLSFGVVAAGTATWLATLIIAGCAILSGMKLFLYGCAGSLVSLWVGHYFEYLQTQSVIMSLDEDEE